MSEQRRKAMGKKAGITRYGGIDMQVCVPKEYTDEQVKDFADNENPCGTPDGWVIRKEGSPFLKGSPERVQCDTNPDSVHITLDMTLLGEGNG